MNTSSHSTLKTGLKYGLILGLVGIAFTMLLQFTNQIDTWISAVGNIPITLALILLAYMHHKRQNEGFMTFGAGLGIATLVAFVSFTMKAFYTFLFPARSTTEMIQKIREAQLMSLEDQGFSDEEIEQVRSLVESLTSPASLLIIEIISGLLFAFIFGLIMAAFNRKLKPETL